MCPLARMCSTSEFAASTHAHALLTPARIGGHSHHSLFLTSLHVSRPIRPQRHHPGDPSQAQERNIARFSLARNRRSQSGTRRLGGLPQGLPDGARPWLGVGSMPAPASAALSCRAATVAQSWSAPQNSAGAKSPFVAVVRATLRSPQGAPHRAVTQGWSCSRLLFQERRPVRHPRPGVHAGRCWRRPPRLVAQRRAVRGPSRPSVSTRTTNSTSKTWVRAEHRPPQCCATVLLCKDGWALGYGYKERKIERTTNKQLRLELHIRRDIKAGVTLPRPALLRVLGPRSTVAATSWFHVRDGPVRVLPPRQQVGEAIAGASSLASVWRLIPAARRGVRAKADWRHLHVHALWELRFLLRLLRFILVFVGLALASFSSAALLATTGKSTQHACRSGSGPSPGSPPHRLCTSPLSPPRLYFVLVLLFLVVAHAERQHRGHVVAATNLPWLAAAHLLPYPKGVVLRGTQRLPLVGPALAPLVPWRGAPVVPGGAPRAMRERRRSCRRARLGRGMGSRLSRRGLAHVCVLQEPRLRFLRLRLQVRAPGERERLHARLLGSARVSSRNRIPSVVACSGCESAIWVTPSFFASRAARS